MATVTMTTDSTYTTTSTGYGYWVDSATSYPYYQKDVKWKPRELTLDEILFDTKEEYEQHKKEIVLDIGADQWREYIPSYNNWKNGMANLKWTTTTNGF